MTFTLNHRLGCTISNKKEAHGSDTIGKCGGVSFSHEEYQKSTEADQSVSKKAMCLGGVSCLKSSHCDIGIYVIFVLVQYNWFGLREESFQVTHSSLYYNHLIYCAM